MGKIESKINASTYIDLEFSDVFTYTFQPYNRDSNSLQSDIEDNKQIPFGKKYNRIQEVKVENGQTDFLSIESTAKSDLSVSKPMKLLNIVTGNILGTGISF